MKFGDIEIDNPLDLIAYVMALDPRDWMADSRDRAIYAVVFGLDGIEEDFRKRGWTEEMIKEYKKLHKRFERLREKHFVF